MQILKFKGIIIKSHENPRMSRENYEIMKTKEFHIRIIKIKQILEFHVNITKIMKILELIKRIIKTMKIIGFQH